MSTAKITIPTEQLSQFDQLIATNAQLMEQHGRVMQEFVQVSSILLGKTTESAQWVQKSFAYTSGLKPKPTKKTAIIITKPFKPANN